MTRQKKTQLIQFGDNLDVTELSQGWIRVDAVAGAGSSSGNLLPDATGHEGDILTVVGGFPVWADAPASTIPPTTGHEGDILEVVAGVPAWADPPVDVPELPPTTGHDGDVLTVFPGGIPVWEDPPAGGGGGTYTHSQLTLSAVWVVVHNLGFHPAVSVVDSGDSVIEPDIHYDSADQLTLTFGAATSGKAYLS